MTGIRLGIKARLGAGLVCAAAILGVLAPAVAREEDEVDPFEGAGQKSVLRLAPWAFHALPFRVFEARNVIDTAAADDAENRLCHAQS